MGFAALLAAVDRAVLQQLGEDGPVRYAPGTGADPVDVRGIFDATYNRADVSEAGVVASGPAVWLHLSDLPTDPEVDTPTITFRGVNYTVREPQKDGKGTVRLLLREASDA